MRAQILASFVIVVPLVVLAGCTDTYTTFGEPMQVSTLGAVDIAKVLENTEKYDGKEIVVRGTVREVCQHKGCWITLGEAGGEETVFVKFTCPLEGRLVPVEAVGHDALVRGKLTVEEISEDEARHQAEDAGASEAEISKITGPQKRIRMASPSAKIEGVQPPAKGA